MVQWEEARTVATVPQAQPSLLGQVQGDIIRGAPSNKFGKMIKIVLNKTQNSEWIDSKHNRF